MSKLEVSEIKEVPKPTLSSNEMVYITIPAADLYDHTHPGVQLNRVRFEAGRTYHVRAEIADEINDRLKKFAGEQVRLLRPNADRKALDDVNKGSQWTSRGGGQMTALDHGLGSMGSATEKIITVDF